MSSSASIIPGVEFAFNIGTPNATSEYAKARLVCREEGVRDGFHADADVAAMLARRGVSLFARRDGHLMRPGEIHETSAEELFLAGISMVQEATRNRAIMDLVQPIMPVLLGETDNQGAVDFVAAGALLAIVEYIRERDPTEHVENGMAQARRLRSAAIEAGAGNPPEDPALIFKASRPLRRLPSDTPAQANTDANPDAEGGATFDMNHGIPNRLSRHGKAQFIGGDGGVPDCFFTDDELDAMLSSKEIHAYATADGRLLPASSLEESVTTEAFFNGAVGVEGAPDADFDLFGEMAPLLALFTGKQNTPGTVDFRLVGRFWALAHYAMERDPITGDFDMSEMAANLREAAIAREGSGQPIDLSAMFDAPSPRRRF